MQRLATDLGSYLVVDVGNIHNELDVGTKIVHQDATNNVGRDIVARMPQMTLVVDSRTAGIPRHLSRLNRHKGHWRARLQGVVDLQGLHCVGCDSCILSSKKSLCRVQKERKWPCQLPEKMHPDNDSHTQRYIKGRGRRGYHAETSRKGGEELSKLKMRGAGGNVDSDGWRKRRGRHA